MTQEETTNIVPEPINSDNQQISQQGDFEIEGIVEEALPSATFRVKLPDGSTVLGHLSGKMRLHYIRVLAGDKVILKISQYDKTKGRIIKRLK